MGALVVSVSGLAALVVAVWLTMRGWGTERPLPLDLSGSRLQRLVVVLRRASGLMAAGVVTGVLVLGFGSRLMMRVLAATSPDSAQGRVTEAEEIVGVVTADGTFGFVVFIGVFSGMVAVGVWIGLRRWLPDRSWVAGVVLAGLGAGLLARPSGLIDPDNRDFVILSPVWLAVLLSVVVMLLFGVSFAVLADRWATRWPTLGATPGGLAAAVPMVAVFGLSAMIVVPALIMAAVVFFVAWKPPLSDRTRSRLARSEQPGRWALGALAGVGTIWVGISAAQVLTL